MEVTQLDKVPAFITKDGSEIRELLAHRNSAIRKQSLAEARLPVGGATQEHYHPKTEEIGAVHCARGPLEGGGADFQVCRVAGFLTGKPSAGSARLAHPRPADWEVGDTAGLETCATT